MACAAAEPAGDPPDPDAPEEYAPEEFPPEGPGPNPPLLAGAEAPRSPSMMTRSKRGPAASSSR